MTQPLFTPRFFVMCAYTFTVFVSLFQLLPAAPYHVLALGGTTFAGGLFLGFLTYASALSAPFTGQVADKLGHRRVLMVVSVVLAAFTATYALLDNYKVLLGLVFVHGLFWSALLSASGAYITSIIPASRRAEGIGYWGLSSVIALAAAPPLGFWVYSYGWTALCLEITALNLLMAFIAWRLPDDRAAPVEHPLSTPSSTPSSTLKSVEWPVMALSVTMALIAFGYGGLTTFSALFADELGVAPRSIFLTSMAITMLVGRLSLGRRLDSIGHRRVLFPCLLITATGMTLVAAAQGRLTLIIAGLAFGAGFGLLYPAYTAYIMSRIPSWRRGAAFGAMLAAFDVGVGSGSTGLGWLIHQFGYRPAFGIAAGLAFLAVPYFLLVDKRLGFLNPEPRT
ncbi:MAG: MFS transporter [Acidobacteria bacterium]|nr:MFS transporter [Acidobacteriota bacterium]